jgi:LemA protein
MAIEWIILIVVLAVLVLGLLIFLGMYNGLVRSRNEVKNSFSQIDVQLKRRNDLIPNLVETVKGYMKHEKTLLENITKARSAIMEATTIDKKAKASNQLTDTLKSLFAVAENYPKLEANKSFLQLQEELSGTESKIAYSRQHYNDVVMNYNNKIETIPTNMVASMFNFKQEKLFEASEEERKNVKVSF